MQVMVQSSGMSDVGPPDERSNLCRFEHSVFASAQPLLNHFRRESRKHEWVTRIILDTKHIIYHN